MPRMTEAQLRRSIRRALREARLQEAEADVVRMGVRLRVTNDARLGDIYTDIRGLENVITVRQEGELEDPPGPHKFVNVFVAFEDDADHDVFGLKRDIAKTPGVTLVVVKNYEGRRWSEVEKTYKGGAASKEQK